VEYKDYYKVLGAPKDASAKQIKQAYRKLARKYHPDINPGDLGAEVRFKEINEAYDVLSDPEKRSKYDQLGANWKQYERVARDHPGGFPGFEGFRVDFGQGQGGERVGGFSDFFKTFFGAGLDLDEILGRGKGGGFRGPGGFGGRGGGVSSAPTKGRDVAAPLEITLEDSYYGSRKKLSLQSHPMATPQEIEVKIPAGVRNGSRIRVTGKGEPSPTGGSSGDLYLEVTLRPHNRYRRESDDLYVEVPITVTEATLGAEIEVPTFTGKARIKVPAGSQSGRLMRLRGKGMPRLKGGGHGDLFAKLLIVVPAKLSDRERELLQELATLQKDNPRAHLGCN
jgi:curved DNA-binding protein